MNFIKCEACGSSVPAAGKCARCGHPLPPFETPKTTANFDAEISEILLREGKIPAIKAYRERNPPVGLAESKEYVERLEAKLPPGAMKASKNEGRGCFYVASAIAILLTAIMTVMSFF